MEPGEYDRIAQLEGRHWWYRGMQAIAAGWLAQWVWPRLAPRPRLLDAGCGTGGALRWLSAQAQVTGLDLHPLALQYAAGAGQPLARGSVTALPFARDSFDVVTCFDVLYHAAVPDDIAALRELARVLRPGGWLLLRVPAYNWLRGAHDRQVHTRTRYTRAGLQARLLAAGLEVRRLSYAGLWLLPPAIVRRRGQSRTTANSDVTLPPAAVNRAGEALLRAEGWWLRRATLPAGLSLLALARCPSA
ncbi:MAG: class I SAM-dependent methyltransferase [Anaerolineales bacterium]|nr:class I SAM-dependent methyltransferase [Anaerolineales bacterium]